jgi:hypothetical protein
MAPAEFEAAIPASERQQTHALDRATTGIGIHSSKPTIILRTRNSAFFHMGVKEAFPINLSVPDSVQCTDI